MFDIEPDRIDALNNRVYSGECNSCSELSSILIDRLCRKCYPRADFEAAALGVQQRVIAPRTVPKAIQTFYAGRFFRSRLEARWAVFYTSIGIPWVYEPEGYRLTDDEFYLPDFWLPQQECFIEVKWCSPTDDEERKATALAQVSEKKVFIFFGQPGFHACPGYPPGQIDSDGAYVYDGGWDNYQTWCVCSTCDRYGIQYEGRASRICRHGSPVDDGDRDCTHIDPRLIRAYDAANCERF